MTSKRNLWEETISILADYGKCWDEVEFVTIGYETIVKEHYPIVASKQYEAGYGHNYVNLELKIVGSDWWLERAEYDGAEWFEFKTLPTKPEQETYGSPFVGE